MKFTLNNDLRFNPMMRVLIGGLMCFALIFLALDLLYKAHDIGLNTTSMQRYILGEPSEFVDPVLFTSLLERVHADTFFSMMLLLTLGAVYGRLASAMQLKRWVIHTTMFSALCALISPLIAYGIGGSMPLITGIVLWAWLITLYSWHIGAAWMGCSALFKVIKP